MKLPRFALDKCRPNNQTRFALSIFIVLIVATGTFAFAETTIGSNPQVSQANTFTNMPASKLDPTGKTIPASNFAAPTDGTAIFMSATGNDNNDGKTLNTPVKTLNSAIGKAPAGGTVVVRGGLYRDWYNSNNATRHINKNLTIQAYQNEKPWFTGADIVTDGWTQQGNIWVRDWNTPQFCGGTYNTPVNGVAPFSQKLYVDSSTQYDTNCVWADNVRDPNYPVAGDPQMAFSNDLQLEQRGSISDVTPGSKRFFYDWNAKKIYVSENPATNTVELSTRPGVFVLGGAYNFAVKGIGFKRYASAFRGNSQATVIFVGLGGASDPAGQAQFENTVFTENAGAVLSFSGPKNNTYVRNSVLAYNHGSGISGNGFSNDAQGARNNIVLDGNLFNENNAGNFDTMCGRSCGVAAVKLNHMVGFKMTNNIVQNTRGKAAGLWCDMDCSDGIFTNNIVRNNNGHGIFYEISNRGIIANNLVYHNKNSQIAVASANTKVYNNTIVNQPGPNVQAVWLWDDRRLAPGPETPWPYWNPRVDLSPNTTGTEFANNLIVAQQPTGARLMNFAVDAKANEATTANTSSNEYFNVLDNNAYYHLTNQNLYMWQTTDAIKSPAQLRSVSGQNWEQNTLDIAGTGDPFVSRSGEDFRIKTDSQAYTAKGRSLPNDVADAIGVSRGTVVNRGALFVSDVGSQPTTTVAPTTAPTTTIKPVTTTTAMPVITTTTTTAKPVTTTTTTTTAKPVTTTTTTTPTASVPPAPVKTNIDIAIRRIIYDHGLSKLKVYSSTSSSLYARGYYPGNFLYIVVDFWAKVDAAGNYTITNVDWKVSFSPFS